MKKLLLLLNILLVGIFSLPGANANTDYPIGQLSTYICDPATGIGTLKLVFGSTYHHLDTRYYTLNHRGYYGLFNSNGNYSFANIGWTYIPGCDQACNIGPTSGPSTHAPNWGGWSHWTNTASPWEGNVPYQFTDRFWPNWVQARSGDYNVAETMGDYQWIGDEAVGFSTAIITFSPLGNGLGQCAKCSSTIDPGILYSSPVTPSCDQGTVTGVSSTETNGTTNYTWSCDSGGGTTVSCNAQYRPLCVPSATDGCCTDSRLAPQCIYAVRNTDKNLSTQDGPTDITLSSTTACRAPIDGKPRVVCDTYTGAITTSLVNFTLPKVVTQKTGICHVVFDAPDTCTPRQDDITFTAKADPSCLGLTETDALKKPECTATVTDQVCIAIKDKYGNPVSKVEADKVTTSLKYVLSATPTNTYYKKNSSIVYVPGTFTEVSPGVVCAPKCDKDHPELCTCQELGTCPPPPPPSCTSTNSCTTCVDNNTCPPPVCIPSAANNNCGDPIVTTITDNTCTPSILNNYCKEPGPVTTVPGGDIITAKKTCTGHIEVWNGTTWTKDGSTILYDEPYDYRIFIDGADPVCSNGVISLSAIAVTGGAFTGGLTYSAADTFRATITKTSTSTPTTPRGVSVKAVFTQPGGSVLKVIPYGLTADPLDFLDNPLQITGDRMKGVRVIGNTAGTNIGEFNLNNGWVVAEQGPITNAARSTMLQKVALLTRGITPNTVVNGILYIEGDINYSSSIIKSSVFNTLIVRGNLTIDENIGSTTNTDGKGIIVLANSTGNGGNIIIGDGVRIIHALIFAEGTLRGVSTLASQLNQSIQLVIKGSLFSRNTIGGSAVSTALYLAGGSKTDDVHAAFVQDLNNVRNGIEYNLDGSPLNPYKGYSDPFIIDYDPALRLLGLPGFTN